jgi:hypothetical protein
MFGTNHFRMLNADVTFIGSSDFEHTYTMGSEVIGDKTILVFRRKMITGYDLKATMLGATGVQSVQPACRTWGGHEDRFREDKIDTFSTSTIGRKGLSMMIEDVAPRVD